MGIELAPERPGGLRIEALYLDGRQQPLAGFNQGVVNDAEKSRGIGVRVLASSASQRFRLDGGWATSRFENPPDPLLEQGAPVVPVEPEDRDAHYLDLNVGMLQSQTKSGRPISLSLGVRHSRIDPQYRTVGAFLQADRQEDTAEASAFLGPVGAQLTYTLAEDNLDDIRSILTTKTRRAAASVSAPLSQLFAGAGTPPTWLPTLSYTLDRTHQFGTGVPPDGEFSISFVPDQVSLNQTAALDWFFPRTRAGVRFGRSFQDNRQEGRDAADLLVSTYGVTFGVTPRPGLDLAVDATSEQAENRELRQDSNTLRYGLNLTWNVSAAVALAALLSWTESRAGSPRAGGTGLECRRAGLLEIRAPSRRAPRHRGENLPAVPDPVGRNAQLSARPGPGEPRLETECRPRFEPISEDANDEDDAGRPPDPRRTRRVLGTE